MAATAGRGAMTARMRWRTHGFGLLEAIVALALLSGTGLALFSWINQNLQTASRLRAQEQEARLLLAAQPGLLEVALGTSFTSSATLPSVSASTDAFMRFTVPA